VSIFCLPSSLASGSSQIPFTDSCVYVYRKCGRVVCANCSPHRITIPQRFIVEPPSNISATSVQSDSAAFVGAGNEDNEEYQSPNGDDYPFLDTIAGTRTRRTGLEHVAEVRVCNPCVPDPNTSPPPQPYHPNSPHTRAASHGGSIFHGMSSATSPLHGPRSQDLGHSIQGSRVSRGMQPRPAGGVYGNRVRLLSDQERYFRVDRPLQDITFDDILGNYSGRQSSVSECISRFGIRRLMNHLRSLYNFLFIRSIR
jgi:hypothetical protein